MLNPNARSEVSAAALIDEAWQLIGGDRWPQPVALAAIADRLEWKLDEVIRDRQAECDADPVSGVLEELDAVAVRLVEVLAVVRVGLVFGPFSFGHQRPVDVPGPVHQGSLF